MSSAVRMLLVEDNPGDAQLVRLTLSEDLQRHFDITVVETLAAALELVQSDLYDVILLDLFLPDSMGVIGLQELALAVPRTPIVVLTGVDDDALAIQASQHGAQDYLVKGKYDQVLLSRAIRCAIERKGFEAVLAQRAYFDSLTGLVNRALFNDRMSHALARAKRAGKRVAVMLIDLDNFKTINDSLGHKGGDDVLRAVAEAMRSAVRQTDTVARLGGDEFTVLLEPLDDRSHANAVAKKILSAIEVPILVCGAQIQVTASIGVAIFPEHGRKPESLLQSADVTMFFAKRSGGNRFLLPEMA